MRVRGYGVGDREGCLRLFDSNVPDDFREGERAVFERFLDALPGPYWVLEDEGRLIGCGGVGVEEDGETASMCWGMVARARQGEGWGRLLLEERLAWARSEPGVRRVALSTSQRTRGFFERLGFRAVRVERDGIGPGLDAVEMKLELSG